MKAQGENILRAILLNPADDSNRLVYADWLEENAEWFEEGGQWGGAVGVMRRAALIRVQIELAAFNNRHGGSRDAVRRISIGQWNEQRQRRRIEEELLTEPNFWRWFGEELLHPWPGMPGVLIKGFDCQVGYFDGKEKRTWQFNLVKGFFAGVILPAGDWVKYCGDIMRRHPIERVELNDLIPGREGIGRQGPIYWVRKRSRFPTGGQSVLPDEIFDLLPTTRVRQPSGYFASGAGDMKTLLEDVNSACLLLGTRARDAFWRKDDGSGGESGEFNDGESA